MKQLISISILLSLVACKKDDPEPPIDATKYQSGMIILNEGLYQQNNSSIAFYSFTEQQVYTQVFFNENDRGLGDTANDMAAFDKGDSSYIIIAVDVSSQLEIVNTLTMKSVAQIPVFDGATPRQPRHVLVNQLKAYSCNYDGTISVVDLNTYQITNTIPVGTNPDGMVQHGTHLYVTNSGGLNYPVYDSTISVVDMLTETEITKYPSRINCTSILADEQGELYVLSHGDYSNVPPAVLRINSQNGVHLDTLDLDVGRWTYYDQMIYYHDTVFNEIKSFNTVNETISPFTLVDCSDYNTLYGIFVNQHGLFTADANGYVNSSTIRCYDHQGDYQYEFTAGLNSTAIHIQ